MSALHEPERGRSAHKDKEVEEDLGTSRKPFQNLSKIIVRSLEVNVISDLPTSAGMRRAMVIYFMLAVFFIYIAISGFYSFRREKFLSLDHHAGICEDIPKDVTGTYLADNEGNWEGEEGFEYSKAIYNFQFFHLETTEDKFYQVIDTYLDKLNELNEIMRTNNFAMTVLYWTTWMMRVDSSNPFSEDNNAHYFGLTGSINTVLNQADAHTTYLSGVGGHCGIKAMARYDKLAASFRITYPDAAKYAANEFCMDILDIRNFGFNPRLPTPQFDIVIDIRTIMACVAVNLGIMSLSSLEKVPFSSGVLNMTKGDGLEEVAYARYYHTRFPNMNTMYCLTELTGETLSCGIYIYSINLFPVFNHLGYFYSLEEGNANSGFCECNENYSYENLLECNAYSFVTGFLFYNFNNTIEMSSEVQNGNYNITHFFNVEGMKDSEDNFFKLISKYRHRLPLLNRNAFNASKEAVVSAFFKTDPNNVQRDLLFKYCTDEMSKSCSLLTIASYSHGELTSISENYYQIPWGHCNVTAAISDEARQKLYKPPVRLTEAYYECKKSAQDSFISAVGLSSATVLSVKVLVVLFVTVVMSRDRNLLKKNGLYKTYGIDERLEALHYFAFNVLLARDGKYTPPPPSERNGHTVSIVQTLADELSGTHFIKRFFPLQNSSNSICNNPKTSNPLHESSFEEEGGIREDTGNAGTGNSTDDDSLSMAKMVHQRKLAAFQEELVVNPFFSRSKSEEKGKREDRMRARRRKKEELGEGGDGGEVT